MPDTLKQEELHNLLKYCPTTGIFTWLNKKPKAYRISVGDIAGRTLHNGYVQVGINRKYYLAHRLAFLYMQGAFPLQQVDHINGNTQDNRWDNLRVVSQSVNSRNAASSRKSTSGVTGVSWNIGAKKWIAVIRINGKGKHLGCFADLDEAIKVRKKRRDYTQLSP